MRVSNKTILPRFIELFLARRYARRPVHSICPLCAHRMSGRIRCVRRRSRVRESAVLSASALDVQTFRNNTKVTAGRPAVRPFACTVRSPRVYLLLTATTLDTKQPYATKRVRRRRRGRFRCALRGVGGA